MTRIEDYAFISDTHSAGLFPKTDRSTGSACLVSIQPLVSVRSSILMPDRGGYVQ